MNTLDRIAGEARRAIELQVKAVSEALYGLRANLMSTGEDGRLRFHRLIELGQVFDRIPGLSGITFDRLVPAAEIEDFERSVRMDRSLDPRGYPAFEVHPKPVDTEAVVVEYVEPFAPNAGVLGFDIRSDPVRRAALEQARDSGAVIGTAPIRLVQFGGSERGFLLMAAIFDREDLPVTAPARRRSFLGVVVAVFRTGELIPATVTAALLPSITIDDVGGILDPSTAEPTSSRVFGDAPVGVGGVADVNVADRRWRVTVAAPVDAFAPNAVASWATAAGGVALTLVVLLSIVSRARRQQIADLEEREVRFRDLDRMKSLFLSTVSHDLRTPITAIVGFANLLEGGRSASMSSDEMLAMISRNAASLDVLIGELNQLTNFEHEGFRVRPRSESLSELVLSAVHQLSPLLADHQVDVQVFPEVWAYVDPGALERILANLLTNAAKFSPKGSVIRVVVSADGDAVLDVQDRGPGVALAEREDIFRRFYRSERTTELAPGTGIGLAVVRELVQLMGGTVAALDASGGGSVFRVRLPIAKGDAVRPGEGGGA